MLTRFTYILVFSLLSLSASFGQNHLENLLQQTEQARKAKDKVKEAEINYKIAAEYLKKKDYTRVHKYLNKSIKTFQKENLIKKLLPAYMLSVRSYEIERKPEKAIGHLLLAKDICIKLDKSDELITCYKKLAENYKRIGDDIKSTEYVNLIQAFDKSKLSDRLKKEVNNLQVNVTVLKEDIVEKDSALVTTNIELEAKKDSLDKAEAFAKMKQMEVELLDKEKKEKEQELKITDANLRAEKLKTTLLFGGIVVLLAMAGLIFYGYRQQKKSRKTIAVQKEKITDSINYAQTIQEAMLPTKELIEKYMPENFVFFMPKDIVSGDFYWFHDVPNEKNSFFISVVDCTGHGVPGAFMSMIGMNMLSEIVGKGITEVNKILEELHATIKSSLKQDEIDNRDGMDMSLCKINMDKKTVEFAGARNPLVMIKNGELEVVPADRKSIGGEPLVVKKNATTEFKKHTIQVTEPTSFYLFSDGYADQLGGNGEKPEKFMTYTFYELFQEIYNKSMSEQKGVLVQRYEDWKGNYEQIDDVCVVGFKFS